MKWSALKSSVGDAWQRIRHGAMESQGGADASAALTDCVWGDYTPQRIAQCLRSAAAGNVSDAMQLYDWMERRMIRLGAVMGLRRQVVASTDFQIVAPDLPEEATQRDRDLAEEIRADCQEMFWSTVTEDRLLELAGAIGSETAVLEIFWEVRDGRAVPGKLARIDPRLLAWRKGELHLRGGLGDFDGLALTPGRYIVHHHPARPGRPGTRALLESLAAIYILTNFGWKGWAKFAETFGTPFRLGKVPASWDKAERDKLLEALADYGISGHAVVTEGATVDLVESAKGGRGTTPFEGLLEWGARETTIMVLGQELTTSAQPTGLGSGTAEVQDRVRQDLRISDARRIGASLREQLLIPFVAWNHQRPDLTPYVQFPEAKAAVDESAVPRLTFALTQARVPVLRAELYQQLGLTEVTDETDEELLIQPPPPAPSPFGGFGPEAPAAARRAERLSALKSGATADRDEATRTAETALAYARKQFSWAEWLKDNFTGVDSFAELQTMIADGDAAPDEELVDPLAQALLVADLSGRASWMRRTGQATTLRRTGSRRRLAALAGRSDPFNISRATFEPLPFDQAVKLMRDKVAIPKAQFDALAATAKKRAFTAAGVSSREALEVLKKEVERAMTEGRTYREFQDDLPARLAAAGYGDETPTNLNLVFHQNVMAAYGAGQWSSMQETKGDFPCWMYVATKDGRTRPEHAALDGKIFRVDDAVAAAYFPPWDYGCRCDAIPMTAEDVEGEGQTITDGATQRRTPITFEQSGQTRTLYAVPKPDFDADPIGRWQKMETAA